MWCPLCLRNASKTRYHQYSAASAFSFLSTHPHPIACNGLCKMCWVLCSKRGKHWAVSVLLSSFFFTPTHKLHTPKTSKSGGVAVCKWILSCVGVRLSDVYACRWTQGWWVWEMHSYEQCARDVSKWPRVWYSKRVKMALLVSVKMVATRRHLYRAFHLFFYKMLMLM